MKIALNSGRNAMQSEKRSRDQIRGLISRDMIIQPRSQNISQKLNISEARNCSREIQNMRRVRRRANLHECRCECVRDESETDVRSATDVCIVLF